MKKPELLGGHGVTFWNLSGAIGRPLGPIGQPSGARKVPKGDPMTAQKFRFFHTFSNLTPKGAQDPSRTPPRRQRGAFCKHFCDISGSFSSLFKDFLNREINYK
jgi:hypothetical protein